MPTMLTPDPAVETRLRRVYLTVRIKILKAELQTLQAESNGLAGLLRAQVDRKSSEAVALKARQRYVIWRPVDIRAELATILREHQDLAPKPNA